jgi:3-phenylpropionate/trans-cinnamate dioxygenase ferredoxin subunit
LGWHEVASESAVGDDEALGVTVGNRQIALCRSGGRLFALDNVCTHQYALLSDGYIEDGCIECPLHQGRFELASGKPLSPPVTEPVRTHPVRAENGKIYVDLQD